MKKLIYISSMVLPCLSIFFFLPLTQVFAITTNPTLTSSKTFKASPTLPPTPTIVPITPSAFNYQVRPTVFDFTTSPGSTLNEEVKLFNNSTSSNILKIQIKRIDPNDTTGNIHLSNFPPGDDSAHWLKFNSYQVVTPPQQWTTVPFQITIPKDAAYGYYWAIVFSTEPPGLHQTGASLVGSVAVPILLVAQKGGVNYTASFTRFDTDQGFYEYPPVTFRMDFKNEGNVHLRPIGNIFIKDWQGKSVATLNINPSGGATLPGGTRTYTVDWDDSFITYETKMQNGQPVYNSSGIIEKTPVIHFNKLLDMRIGQYTATAILVVQTDQRDVPYQLTTTFFIFPWKIIAGVVIIALLILLGLTFSIRSLILSVRRIFAKK